MNHRVAAFTDTYLPTVNGVTYTVKCWRDRWNERVGRMDVVFPETAAYRASPGEHPVRSVGFPFYDGFRFGAPTIPASLDDVAIVHAHTPFAVGLAALRLARRADRPLVASYHTPASEYARYVAPSDRLTATVRALADRYERWFYDRADLVIAPSTPARTELRDRVGVSTPVRVLSNGVDLDRFRPVDPDGFRQRYDLDGPLVGYTGRHGHEKRLSELLIAVSRAYRDDLTVVLSGDGPARPDLERLAADLGIDARFLGFLDREELPAFYSALDAFGFPSPVETQGLVALEANACGTPVVGVDAGALSETIVAGETGYRYPPGEVDAFGRAIDRAIDRTDDLRDRCLARRGETSVRHAIDRLEDAYESVR